MKSYRPKSSQPFAEFRERVTEAHPRFTIELECTYTVEFCGEHESPGLLMRSLPRGACFFDREGGKVWRILPQYKQDAIDLALAHYSKVYETTAEETTELHTGAKYYPERMLF